MVLKGGMTNIEAEKELQVWIVSKLYYLLKPLLTLI